MDDCRTLVMSEKIISITGFADMKTSKKSAVTINGTRITLTGMRGIRQVAGAHLVALPAWANKRGMAWNGAITAFHPDSSKLQSGSHRVIDNKNSVVIDNITGSHQGDQSKVATSRASILESTTDRIPFDLARSP